MSTGSLARSLYRRVADASDRYERRRLVVPISDQRTAAPTVYFLTPDHQTPAGGIRVIYRHVDILNSAGLRAFVLHQRRGFQCSWFEHNTNVTNVESGLVRRGDILVIPEIDADLLSRLPAGTRHVIFNQNSHLTWNRVAGAAMQTYAAGADLIGVVTVSRHNQEMLRYAFPGCAVHRLHVGIDANLFHYPQKAPSQRISYMPRRGRDDARQVLEILRGRHILDGWDVVALDGLTHSQVADQLRTSRIFLAFTYQEGFGLPAAEAMACGNYVIGYHGFGGREFFHPEFSAPIETGDTLEFACAVENAVISEAARPGWCAIRGKEASRFILSEYSNDREKEDVSCLYRDFVGQLTSSRE